MSHGSLGTAKRQRWRGGALIGFFRQTSSKWPGAVLSAGTPEELSCRVRVQSDAATPGSEPTGQSVRGRRERRREPGRRPSRRAGHDLYLRRRRPRPRMATRPRSPWSSPATKADRALPDVSRDPGAWLGTSAGRGARPQARRPGPQRRPPRTTGRDQGRRRTLPVPSVAAAAVVATSCGRRRPMASGRG